MTEKLLGTYVDVYMLSELAFPCYIIMVVVQSEKWWQCSDCVQKTIGCEG